MPDVLSDDSRIQHATRHATEGNALIERQGEIIARLERKGSDTLQALALMKNLLISQELHFTGLQFSSPVFLKAAYVAELATLGLTGFAGDQPTD